MRIWQVGSERAPWRARADGRLTVAVGLDPECTGENRWEATIAQGRAFAAGLGPTKETALDRAKAVMLLGAWKRRRRA